MSNFSNSIELYNTIMKMAIMSVRIRLKALHEKAYIQSVEYGTTLWNAVRVIMNFQLPYT